LPALSLLVAPNVFQFLFLPERHPPHASVASAPIRMLPCLVHGLLEYRLITRVEPIRNAFFQYRAHQIFRQAELPQLVAQRSQVFC